MAGDAGTVPVHVAHGRGEAEDSLPGSCAVGSAGAGSGAPGVRQSEPDDGLGRIAADQTLVEVLAAAGFAGPRFDRFRDELARYGVSVLSGWMCSGYVFQLAARRGFALRPTAAELNELHCDADLRQELAVMIVAVALPSFREHALVGGGWRADGGARLTTYFLGACLTAFPNEFRKHRSARQRRASEVTDEDAAASRTAASADPAELVVGTMHVREELARMDKRTRAMVALRMDGYRQDEIAEMLGESSVRAVEGVLYRWRVRQARPGSEGGG